MLKESIKTQYVTKIRLLMNSDGSYYHVYGNRYFMSTVLQKSKNSVGSISEDSLIGIVEGNEEYAYLEVYKILSGNKFINIILPSSAYRIVLPIKH